MNEISVMVNGLSPNAGKMARKVAEHVAESDDMELYPFSLTGPEVTEKNVYIHGKEYGDCIELIKPEDREMFIKSVYPSKLPNISVDCTSPLAVNDNADFYCSHNMRFVMLTTGGDRKALKQRVLDSNIPAVIDVNMAKEIVGFKEIMGNFAEDLEGAWIKDKNSGLYIRESHQGVDVLNNFRGKADTSGTAKALVEIFQKIGIPYEVSQIAKIRDREDQLKLGVPEWALDGHGWHRYKLWAFNNSKNKNILPDAYKEVYQFMLESPVFSKYDAGYGTDKGDKRFSGFQLGGIVRESPNKDVMFRLEMRYGEIKIDHNVNGRNVYALGTLDAIRFLYNKVKQGTQIRKEVYNMIDVKDAS